MATASTNSVRMWGSETSIWKAGSARSVGADASSAPMEASIGNHSAVLPNVAGVFRDHRLTSFATPSLLKLRHILRYTVDAVFARRVRIRAHLHPQIFRTLLFTPDPAESEEEPLFGCGAIDLLTFLPSFVLGNHMFQSRQRNSCAAIVGGI